MRILTYKNLFYPTLILCFLNLNLLAQDSKTTIHQDPKFEQLLNEKRNGTKTDQKETLCEKKGNVASWSHIKNFK